MAHGAAAVIALLARAAGVGVAAARPLLDAAVPWLLAQRIDGAGFPSHARRDGVPSSPARTAWCYGDPGIAAGYLAAVPDASLRWQADPGFLGGAAGVALALLAATTPLEPSWDRVLLLS